MTEEIRPCAVSESFVDPPVSRLVTLWTRRATAPCTSRTVPRSSSSAVSVARDSASRSPAWGRSEGPGRRPAAAVNAPVSVSSPKYATARAHIVTRAVERTDDASGVGLLRGPDVRRGRGGGVPGGRLGGGGVGLGLLRRVGDRAVGPPV